MEQPQRQHGTTSTGLTMSKKYKKEEKTLKRYSNSGTTAHVNGNSKVLVTGGAAFFGSHICEKLLLDGKHVIVVDVLNNETSTRVQKKDYVAHLNELSKNKEGAQFRLYEVDILQENLLSQVL